MPRVLLLFEFSTLNGGENSMLASLERLQHGVCGADGNGFDFHALVPDSGPLAQELARLDVPTTVFQQRDESGTKRPREELLPELRGLIEQDGPDLLHANSLSMGRLTGALGERCTCRRTAHLRDIIRLSRAAIRDLNQNDCLVAVSHATARAHIAQGLDERRTDVVHNGVDCERFAPRERTNFWDDKLAKRGGNINVSPERFVALTIGQIGLRKGLDTLAEAAARLGPDRGIDFVLVGERFSQKQESIDFDEAINRRFAEAGMSHRQHRLGYRNDVPRLMNEANVLVHAAKQEPFGRVLLEAGASGLPIIATDVGGTGEMLRHEESALLVPAGDVSSLASAICRVQEDQGLRWELASAARLVIESQFSIETATACLASLWKRVLRSVRI